MGANNNFFQVTIKYSFAEILIPKKYLKVNPQYSEDIFTAKIHVINRKNAPVAFLVKEYSREPRKVRLYNGNLYRQIQYAKPQIPNSIIYGPVQYVTPKNQTAEAVNWQSRLLNFGTWNKKYCYLTQGLTCDLIKLNTQKYIIVDGMAYERIGEPYYYTDGVGTGNNEGFTGFFIGWAKDTDREIWGWTALDKAAAIEKTVKLAINRGDTDSIENILNPYYNIEVFIPEAIKCKYDDAYLFNK